MDQGPPPPVQTAGFFDRILLRVAGVDEATLRLCPQKDWENVRAVAAIMIFVWIYQIGVLSLFTHRAFAAPGELRPELILISAFLATFILLIDSYVIMRSGWHLSGIAELKRGGIDISGGFKAGIKSGIFAFIRIFLAGCMGLIMTLSVALMTFTSDIAARIHTDYLARDSALILATASQVDARISQTKIVLDAAIARETALASQVNALRQNQIDPAANRLDIQQASREVEALLSEKSKADEALQKAETFASAELAGTRFTQDNSGIPGDGPRRKAAMEAIGNAKTHAQQISSALDAARGRADALRQHSVVTDEATKQQALSAMPHFEAALAVEERRVGTLQDTYDRQVSGRDDTIRQAVFAAPNYVPPETGLLAQIAALEHIAQDDPKIAFVIILIDLVSFGFELSAVLAKITAFVPATYTALLARDGYMNTVRIVDGMLEELDRGPGGMSADGSQPPAGPQSPPSSPIAPGMPPADQPVRPHPFGSFHDGAPAIPKRPRGRPPKATPGGQDGSPLPFGNGYVTDEP